MGATAVEDLLAEDVGSCIKDYREAGISVWMLTGDKGETAKEIALSCQMLDRGSESNLIEIGDDEDWRPKIRAFLREKAEDTTKEAFLLVGGPNIERILNCGEDGSPTAEADEKMIGEFLAQVKSLIVYRSSPS